MVDPARLIVPEIAAEYGVSPHTVTKSWARRSGWPEPVDRRGKHKEYDAEAVATFVRDHVDRPAVELEPHRLYTAQQLEAAGIGITAGTIRSDLSRGRWPAPDDTSGGTKRWAGATVTAALAGRQAYRRQPKKAASDDRTPGGPN